MAISASELRADIYRLLDQVLETGEPLEIERKGQIIRVMPPPRRRNLGDIPANPNLIAGDPEALVEIDWSPDLWV